MKITVFTSNQPRHLELLRTLAEVADVVFAVQECVPLDRKTNSVAGRNSDIIEHYFSRVNAAEKEAFRPVSVLPPNVSSIALSFGDLSSVPFAITLRDALDSDYFITFGCSWIRGPLCSFLEEKHAVNLHPGVCPFYRGIGSNFWAMYDNRPDLVGCTVHRLVSSLDRGGILFHALPRAEKADPFTIGMRSVVAAIERLGQSIRDRSLQTLSPIPQATLGRGIRHTRGRDLTDETVVEYLSRIPSSDEMLDSLQSRDWSSFVRPFVSRHRVQKDMRCEVLPHSHIVCATSLRIPDAAPCKLEVGL